MATRRVDIANISRYQIESALKVVVVVVPPFLLPPLFLPPIASISIVSIPPPTAMMLHRPCFELVGGKDVVVLSFERSFIN
jgi:hypothetical protein